MHKEIVISFTSITVTPLSINIPTFSTRRVN